MKKWWGGALLAAGMLLFQSIGCYAEPALSDRGQILRVGYVPNTGFVEEDWPGHRRGYGYEYMEFLANYGDWVFEYVPSATWLECAAKLQSGEIDLLPEMPGNYRILTGVKRTDHVIGRIPMELVVASEDAKPHMRIGTYSSSYPIPNLPNIAAGEGFTYDLINYPLFYDMEEAFSRGELDGYVAPMLNTQESRHVLEIFDRQSYRMLVREDRTDLLKKMNSAMDQMLLYQSNIRDHLDNKYMRAKGVPLILNRGERDYLKEKGKLSTVIMNERRPYAFMENGALHGVIPEIINQISKDLGIEIEIVHTDSQEAAERLIRTGQVDFAADAVCDFSWASGLNIRPTQFYMEYRYVPVTRKGELTSDTFRVACVKDLLFTKTYLGPRFPEERRVYFSSLEDCFKAVNDGDADIVFAPRGEVAYLVEQTGAYQLEVGSESDFSDFISLGVYRYGDLRLWQILNKEINHLDQRQIREIINRTERSTRHVNLQWLIYHYPFHALLILIGIASVIIGILWYRFKVKRNHMEMAQRMAYIDLRYELPNLTWFEIEGIKLINGEHEGDYKAGKLYVSVFSQGGTAAVVELYGRKLLDNSLRDLAADLDGLDWVLLTAVGNEAGRLVCICKGESDADMLRKVSSAIAEYGYISANDSRIWMHMQAGVCPLRQDNGYISQTVDRASIALSELHESNDEVRMFDNSMQERLILEQKIESRMEQALADGEFKAWYQPKYDIRTGRTVGAEALVRWISADMGFMHPGKFIPLFEKNGFVLAVDFAILEQAFQYQRRRLDEGKEVVPISVNQSRLHMTEDGYLDKMKAIVERYRLPEGLIELELTETVFGDFDETENHKNAASIVNELHKMGFTISVDDFGSGYSSYMLLNQLPMDVMKIDRSLLTSSEDSSRMKAILGNVIQLGKSLNMRVICEGIETKEQERLLVELGCNYGQGYLNGKPMNEEDFTAFFEARNGALGPQME